MLKKGIFTAFAFMLMSLLASCSSSRNLTQQEDIVKLFHDNEDIILSAIESNDFTKIEDIQGIQKVYIPEEGTYIDFSCGGEGFAQTPLIMAFSIHRTMIRQHGTAASAPIANWPHTVRDTDGRKKTAIMSIMWKKSLRISSITTPVSDRQTKCCGTTRFCRLWILLPAK